VACASPRPRSAPRCVATDWILGHGGGFHLIADSVADGLIDPGLLPEIDQAVTGAYLTGLRAGG
jgi:hypothetical protein